MSFIGTFFLLVVVLGTSELFLLVKAASQIGFLTTLVLCVLTGIIGGSLVRLQGLQTLREIQGALARGQVPAVTIVSGLVLLALGVMLILPGFITDALGFALLVPPLRQAVAGRLVRHYEHRVSLHIGPMGGSDPFAPGPTGPRRGPVIDVDPGPEDKPN